MCMCEQMILAIFIIAITFWTIPEFQIRIIQFCSSADCASVFCPICIAVYRSFRMSHLALEIILSFHLTWCVRLHITWTQEKNDKVQYWDKCCKRIRLIIYTKNTSAVGRKKSLHNRIDKIQAIKYSQPFDLNRNNEK